MGGRLARLASLLIAISIPAHAAEPTSLDTHRAAGLEIRVIGELRGFTLTSTTTRLADGIEVLALTLRSPTAAVPPQFSLQWSIPSHDIAGHWMTGRGQTKTIRPDWSTNRLQNSMFALEAGDGRDYASVNIAADRLMTDVIAALKQVKPDVAIEFRQPYIGPLIRKYGNMLRASDSPNAYLANKVKTIDLRLLSGHTAVHADMIMWHEREPVELAAFQLLNILFSVPQLSVHLREIPPDHFEMVKFYTGYWLANRDVLLDAPIEARAPLSNYPMVSARTHEKQIIALYTDMVARIGTTPRVDLINAKNSRGIVLAAEAGGVFVHRILDCRGRVIKTGVLRLGRTPQEIEVPVGGLLTLTRQ